MKELGRCASDYTITQSTNEEATARQWVPFTSQQNGLFVVFGSCCFHWIKHDPNNRSKSSANMDERRNYIEGKKNLKTSSIGITGFVWINYIENVFDLVSKAFLILLIFWLQSHTCARHSINYWRDLLLMSHTHLTARGRGGINVNSPILPNNFTVRTMNPLHSNIDVCLYEHIWSRACSLFHASSTFFLITYIDSSGLTSLYNKYSSHMK